MLNLSNFKITLIRLSKVASCQWKSPHTWLCFMQPATWLSTSLQMEFVIKCPWNRSHLLKTIITMVCSVQCKLLCNFSIASALHVHRLKGSQNGLTNKKFNACPQLNTYCNSLWIFSRFGEKIAWSVLKMAFRAFK